jgi:hypothetical protein
VPKVAIENVIRPGRVYNVDGDKYEAMKAAFLRVLPPGAPGLTADEIRQRIAAHLPERHFPGGAKAGWWMKAVQLDLEAKGIVMRARTKPLRWHRVATR